MMSEFGKRETFALRAGAKQHRTHARRHAEAISRHVAGEKLHRVVNRQPGRDRAAGRIDVNVDVLFAVLHLQKKQLRDDQIGDVIVDRRADENDPVLQQPRVDIVAAFAAAGLLHHHRDEHDCERFSLRHLMIFLFDGRFGFVNSTLTFAFRKSSVLPSKTCSASAVKSVVFFDFLAHFFRRNVVARRLLPDALIQFLPCHLDLLAARRCDGE